MIRKYRCSSKIAMTLVATTLIATTFKSWWINKQQTLMALAKLIINKSIWLKPLSNFLITSDLKVGQLIFKK